jgi:2-haloacid dehalogenase
MPATLAFDVYGTLVDTNGVVTLLKGMVGERAAEFAQRWRDKQLEYSFRRALMQRYQPFAVCVAQSLDYVSDSMAADLTNVQKDSLLQFFRTLPAFDDVEPALQAMQQVGFNMYAFSNGQKDAVEGLLVGAGIRQYFDGVASVGDVKSFKPDPAVYQHCLKQTGSSATDTWLVSGNPFDVVGAMSAGFNGAWIQRSPLAIFDTWGESPDLMVDSLTGLIEKIRAR